MSIRIRDSADPLSDGARLGGRNVIMVRSEASRVLRHELERYCNRQTQGRSFLIAGHRGAGKTTMVADALYQTLQGGRAATGSLRPLPIFLNGPSLLVTLPSDRRRDGVSLADIDGNGKHNGKSNGAARPQGIAAGAQADALAAQARQVPESAQTSDDDAKDAQRTLLKGELSVDDEKQAQLALVHVILGLHRAVMNEFASAYRHRILRVAGDLPGGDAGELAAQFEIELFEDPPAGRLREYWQHAKALTDGILFDTPPAGIKDQGGRELVAINGVCNAHQRISGALNQTERQKRERNETRESIGGFDAKAVDAFKPLGAVFAGAAVTGGAALGPHELLWAGLLGAAVAWASSLFLKSTSTRTGKRERSLDQVFIPDLTPRTLDRVLPTLVDRLREAGLAPILIIDELDKVEDLVTRIDHLICYLKKLMAESVFSCFLTDRGYLEYLRMERGDHAYGRASSYFSHRLLVTYAPQDVDAYLSELLEARDESDDEAVVDREVLKWVLRHRSQLHALTLNRELAAIRGDDGRLTIPPGALRTDYQYRIDVTLQMAIELQLYSKEVMGWMQRRQTMQQTLFDALYYLSRSWLRGDERVDLTKAGRKRILEELAARMNLREAGGEKRARQPQSGSAVAARTPSEPDGSEIEPLNDDDRDTLCGVLDDMAQFLGPANTEANARARWNAIVTRLKLGPDALPVPEVMSALLLSGDSLLVRAAGKARTGARKRTQSGNVEGLYEWRYRGSGLLRDERAAQLVDTRVIREQAKQSVAFIKLVEDSLMSALAEADADDIQVFSVLSEGCRVLSTTPAWSQVRAAIENLGALEGGAGNPASIENDCRIVRDFEQVLRDGSSTLLDVIFAAALLSGVSSAGPQPRRPLTVRDAVSMLSTGLGFARLDLARTRDSAATFWASLRKAHGAEAGKTIELTDQSFGVLVAEWIEKGRSWPVKWSEQEVAAWRSVESRLESHEAGKGQLHASVEEILCAARLTGPSPIPGLDLERVPLSDWSQLLLDRMSTRQLHVAPWLLAFALRRLGAHILPQSATKQLLAAMEVAAPGVEQRFRSLARASQRRELAGAQLAIVVRASQNSLTNDWALLPTLGMVLVVEAKDLQDPAEPSNATNASVIQRVLQGLQETPVLLAWEEPPDSDDEQSEVLKRFAKHYKERVRPIYLYANETLPMKSPAVVDPRGPDALFRQHRNGQSRS